MRAAKAVLVIWMLCAIALWVRSGQNFSVLDTLPFVERRVALPPDYDWFALAVLATGLWGLVVLTREPSPAVNPPAKKVPIVVVLLVPVTIVGLALLTARVTLAVSFADLVGHPDNLLKYQYLAILTLLVIAGLLAVKWFRSR